MPTPRSSFRVGRTRTVHHKSSRPPRRQPAPLAARRRGQEADTQPHREPLRPALLNHLQSDHQGARVQDLLVGQPRHACDVLGAWPVSEMTESMLKAGSYARSAHGELCKVAV